MPRRIAIVSLIALLAIITTTLGGFALAQTTGHDDVAMPLVDSSADSSNLLTNGDMDQLPFYPRPTNHYVAGQWLQWWGDYRAIPEYVDGGERGRQQCYPIPADGRCHGSTIGAPNNSSQGYIRWGAPYIAGIYQPVTQGVVPCTLYTFEIWNRNDSHLYNAKVGIDVTGWIITRLGTSGPANCPPDGQSVCPDPYIESFPSSVIWSPESGHAAYTWAPLRVTAEAATSKISVWTYAAPDPGQISHSTYWDYGSLVQTPFPGDRLPAPTSWAPTGFVYNVNATPDLNNNVVVSWQTPSNASTQVWYAIYPPAPTIASTDSLTHTAYLPMIAAQRAPNAFTFMTTLDTTPKTWHQVVIPAVPADHRLVLLALSRRPIGQACTTEVSQLLELDLATNRTTSLDPSRATTLLPEPIVAQP